MKVISAFGVNIAFDDHGAVMPACSCEVHTPYIRPSGIWLCIDCGLPLPLPSDITTTRRGGWRGNTCNQKRTGEIN